jgi:hypothetical protein
LENQDAVTDDKTKKKIRVTFCSDSLGEEGGIHGSEDQDDACTY